MRCGDVVAGRYRLHELLGEGGMGQVWRATDLELGRVVALKQALDGQGDQIRREARTGAGLLHPHVIAVFDTVVDGGTRWLVTEYLDAVSLQSIIETEGPVTEERVVRIAAQLAAALEAMHERGIVHRDIKPANVLIAEGDVAKFTDLGIARWAEITHSGGARLTGTLGYLAPEVANGAEATAAADVFSLGATLYAAVEGGSPWGDGSAGPFAQLKRAGQGRPLPVTTARTLAPLLSVMMDRIPARRPAAAAVVDLVHATRVPARRRWWGARTPRLRSRRVVLAVGAVATVSLIVSTGLGALDLRETGSADRHTAPLTEQVTAGLGVSPTEADPCAVIPPGSLTSFGQPFLDPELLNFNTCVITVTLPGGKKQVTSRVRLERSEQYPSRPVEPGRLGPVERVASGDLACERRISLPDTNRVVVASNAIDDVDHLPVCQIADALMLDVVTTVAQRSIPRRTAPFDPQSLARLKACDLLGARVTEPVLGEPPEPREEFGGWECGWSGKDAVTDLTVQFSREWPVIGDPDWNGTPIKVGNRDALLIRDGTTSCAVMVVHRAYTPRLAVLPGNPPRRDEVVVIEFTDKASPTSAATCAAVQKLSKAAVDRLPAAA